MRLIGKLLGRLVLILAVLALLAFFFGPREPVDTEISFDPTRMGEDLDAYLSGREAAVEGITPGVAKQIVWAGEAGAKTPLALVYLHGFSATSAEIRPVPDMVAANLGANLFFTRLKGHGLPGTELAKATAGDWIEDLAEALAIGQRIGEKVVVIGTSTGGTLAALAAADDRLAELMDAVVFVSPNFQIANPAAPLLTMPFARSVLPPLVGELREWEGQNPDHEKFWTNSYPTVAVLPMAALVAHTRTLDFTSVRLPALFVFSDDDQVVKADATRKVAGAWGGMATTRTLTMEDGDDPLSHVIAGDIMSPGQTIRATEIITDWVAGL